MDYSNDWTKEEWDIALTAVLDHRTRIEALERYQRRLNREPCCERELLDPGCACSCWMDRWC